MLILSLDTSSAGGSAALVRDGAVAIELAGDRTRTQGERLPRELMAVLDGAGAALADVDLFAVAVGPGSFTGLRVGMATMQGLAFAKERRVVPVTTFDALAFRARASGALGIWIDAHRGEVFGVLRDASGRDVQGPSSRPPHATLDAWAPHLGEGPVRFTGDGAFRHRDVIRERLGERALVDDSVPLLAGAVGQLAAAHVERAVLPHALVPLYVRRPDAELARDGRKFD